MTTYFGTASFPAFFEIVRSKYLRTTQIVYISYIYRIYFICYTRVKNLVDVPVDDL